MQNAARIEFDRIFESILAKLPADVKRLLEEVPVMIEDEPSADLLAEVGLDGNPNSDLCGLHAGIPLNQRSVFETPFLPGQIYLFRGPIYRTARGSKEQLHRQIEVTLLHELGHHFGFDHAKMRSMGYA